MTPAKTLLRNGSMIVAVAAMLSTSACDSQSGPSAPSPDNRQVTVVGNGNLVIALAPVLLVVGLAFMWRAPLRSPLLLLFLLVVVVWRG